MSNQTPQKITFNKENIMIQDDVLELNLKFYIFIKHLNNSNKLTENQLGNILIKLHTHHDLISDNFDQINRLKEIILDYINTVRTKARENFIEFILNNIFNKNDFILLQFALDLTLIKPLILGEAKVLNYSRLIDNAVHPLSLAYDQLRINEPYLKRVKGALITYLFFDKLNQKDLTIFSIDTHNYINSMIEKYEYLKKLGLNANQMFMLMFSQSMDQSITSEAGSRYESRISEVLISQGISNFTKKHDQEDHSTEFDFFFTLEGKQYGISAKRTLRERYKQFIKTPQMSQIDVMIQVTLGIDLSPDKVDAIRKYSVYLFVANEIYQEHRYLRDKAGVFSVIELTKETLVTLH